ncbi:MAG: hypothetical protein ACTTJV_09515 [Ottowia sp.]
MFKYKKTGHAPGALAAFVGQAGQGRERERPAPSSAGLAQL